jgi:mycofactocin biosynthetic radical S-adenosylmethionine protein MftC
VSASRTTVPALVKQLKSGLDSPICLTWELTYACNLECVHCLSSSGQRDPNELSTAEAKAVIDELHDMQVFYINVGGGEPLVRRDFFELLEYAISRNVGVKFSTNGYLLDEDKSARLASMDNVDIQLSLDGVDAGTNDPIRGEGSYAAVRKAMVNLNNAGFTGYKISVVVTNRNVGQLDAFEQLANDNGAELRLTRLRPSGRGADVYNELRLTQAQQVDLYNWLITRPHILTGDSFFHLSALGETLPGLNLCGAGRVVCLIDPVGDIYACPFVIHDNFLAGNVRDEGGFDHVWKQSDLFTDLRQPENPGACASCNSYDACGGGCMAAKFFTGIPLAGPDPECVFGNADEALANVTASDIPVMTQDHSKPNRVKVTLGRRS